MLAQATTGLPPSSATSVQLLIDGAATLDALLDAVAAARNHVHLEYYIYMPDQSGTLLRDALIERARAGIKVRVLLDAVGSSSISRNFLQPLLDAGAEFAWFHPTRFRPFTRPWLNLPPISMALPPWPCMPSRRRRSGWHSPALRCRGSST